MVVGGYGANYLVTGGAHDPLQVRAFFVGHGKQAVTFVSVDSQGWFAAYQTPNVGDGADDARRDAAAALAARGYDVSAANVVVSATHDHAAPTIMGIWGHTDPEYLHRVKRAAVQAVLEAEANARAAELWSATGTIQGLVSQIQGTDQMAGFARRHQLPVLWAREPGTGATIAHVRRRPDPRRPVQPDRGRNNQFSADYPGWVRDRLAQLARRDLGHRAGHARAPGVDRRGLELRRGRRAGSLHHEPGVARAHARPSHHRHHAGGFDAVVLDGGREHRPARGHVLQPRRRSARLPGPAHRARCQQRHRHLGLERGRRDLHGQPLALRAMVHGGSRVGSSATVARVGDQLYATAPGEAFDEVTSAAQRMFAGSDGIRGVHIIDHAGDQLGYYWDQRPGVYPAAQLAQSDFARFNVGSHLAQDNVDAVLAAGQALGLAPTAEHPYAEIDNPNAFSEPTIQFYSDQVETDDPAVSFYATSKKAQAAGSSSTSIGSSAGTQGDGLVAWDFGDGTTETQPTRHGSRTRSRRPARTASRPASPTTSARPTAGSRW